MRSVLAAKFRGCGYIPLSFLKTDREISVSMLNTTGEMIVDVGVCVEI
jgi:hypothetical protein